MTQTITFNDIAAQMMPHVEAICQSFFQGNLASRHSHVAEACLKKGKTLLDVESLIKSATPANDNDADALDVEGLDAKTALCIRSLTSFFGSEAIAHDAYFFSNLIDLQMSYIHKTASLTAFTQIQPQKTR